MSRIEEKLQDTLQRYEMLHDCARIVVGFSGGADSTALLHYLHTHFDGEVVAAHVNHLLRGEESLRDEAFVRDFCQQHGIPLAVRQVDVASLAKERNQTIEECGRSVRYAFFQSLCGGESDRIATAHTLSDSVETVLFHMTRGTGNRGLCGIPPVRDRIIRPLIDITREEVEAYCTAHRLSFVQDSTNFSTDYTRNRIRLSVVPQLREINPAFVQAVGRLSRQMMEQEAALTSFAEQMLREAERDGGYVLAVLQRYPKATVLQGILLLLRQRQVGEKVTDQKLQAVYNCIRTGTGGVTVSGTLEIRAEQGLLLFVNPQTMPIQWEIPFAVPQTVCVCGKQVGIRLISRQNCKINENNSSFLFSNGLDYDTIATNAVFRTRRAGDTFRPRGRGVTKTLKKLLQEAAVPASRRDQLIVLAQGSTLLWAEGFGAAEGFAVTTATQRAVEIIVKEKAADASGFGACDTDTSRDCGDCHIAGQADQC